MRLTAERVKKAVADGLTMNETARRHNVLPSTVGKWKRRLGLEFRREDSPRKPGRGA